ncbi:alkaline phosphatase family protein [Salinigranum halophilum]|uniref:hypothetical protein n=1 Tax=Salinigranum halophilum TaxID=2565931 RepID=UPI0010A7ECE2|nr:hypothetical protein [Salinigranum halophilum]
MVPLRHALSEVRRNFADVRWWRNVVFIPYVVGTATRYIPSYPGYDQAVSVMDEDWDNLIILDACRADAFEALVDLSAFDAYEAVVSQGSHSKEWTKRNFVGESFGDTVYVSANPHTTLLADDVFHDLFEVWTEYDIAPNQIDPSVMIDEALRAHDQYPDKRLIVHFMQPHGTGGLVEPREDVRETYDASITAVIEYVHDLIEQLDGKTVITADHGQLFNHGLKRTVGLTGHPARLRCPGLVYVPWAVVEGDGTRRPVTVGQTSKNETERAVVEQRLRDLGYHA